MLTSDFDYLLPEELIADFPSTNRDESNLMVLNRQEKTIQHKKFFQLVEFFDENDILVLNNTRVIPARLFGKKVTNGYESSSGAKIEVFLLERQSENKWTVLIKPSKRVKSAANIEFSPELSCLILKQINSGKWLVEFLYNREISFDDILLKVGNIPIPPYIEKKRGDAIGEEIKKLDFERYQTVYNKSGASVAAPTAGLHFTQEILDALNQKGVKTCFITLNVGLGTFKPVKAESVFEHKMEREYYEIPEITSETINRAKKEGKRLTAVGTTTVRTLETAFQKYGEILPVKDFSEAFIYPGYKFRVVNRLITNFHLPKSTLIMLASAFAGRDFIFSAYKKAIEEKYRFYSYGDCMLIN